MIARQELHRWLSVSSLVIAGLLMAALAPPRLLSQDRFAGSDTRSRDATANTAGSWGSTGSTWQGNDWLGGATLEQRQWRLGIDGTDTETGVLIRSVAPRSAAERARLLPGDSIVAVEGYQVGNVAGRLYALPEELNRRADASGNVSLLVHDHRSGRLTTLRLRLDTVAQPMLTGNLIHTARPPIPADAVITVQIENVSRPFYVVRNGQTTLRATSQGIIPFQITYDPNYIDPQDVYRVRAWVTSGNRTILETQNPQNVLTQGNPSEVRLNLSPITQSSLVSGSSGGTVISAGYPNYGAIDQQLTTMYLQYLGRRPTSLELAALRQTPGIENRLRTMPLELMAAQEYFDLVGNNNQVWLERVFREIVGKPPRPDELNQWMQRYADVRFSRTELLRQLNQQANRF